MFRNALRAPGRCAAQQMRSAVSATGVRGSSTNEAMARSWASVAITHPSQSVTIADGPDVSCSDSLESTQSAPAAITECTARDTSALFVDAGPSRMPMLREADQSVPPATTSRTVGGSCARGAGSSRHWVRVSRASELCAPGAVEHTTGASAYASNASRPGRSRP